jgi:hypothetical protein
MTQVNELRNEWGYPNSARALSESAVRARAGPGRFGALSAVREEQPEVKPYCACESCACLWKRGCASWRRAGLAVCGPVRGEGRAIAGPGAGRCEGRAEALLAGGVRAAGRGCAWWFRARPGDIKL